MHCAIARLITKRPHDDAWMILIAFHHAADARHPCCSIRRVVTQAGIPGMAFRIGFVNDIQTQFITQVKQARIIRVMRTTHCIHIVLLHQHKVCANVFNTDCFALIRVVVVAVHAANHHALAVYQ